MTITSDPSELVQRFGWPDYVVFALMLAVSAVIGVYYAIPRKKKDEENQTSSTEDFLMGGRSMGTFPVAMSLIASFMSAITLLGTPAEMYLYGTMYWVIGISYFLVMPASAYLYLPIFYKLQVTSAYEYLERRFHRVVRMLGSATFSIQMTLYMAVVVYAPALALSQVTGIDVYVSVCSIFVVCIFYTALGGLKAVMWTDAFQVIVMYGSMIAICIKGDYDAGGGAEVIKKNYESGRVEFFEFSPNPAVRHSVWSLVVGGYFNWATIYAVNQSQVQRYLSVPTIKQAQKAIWINLLGLLGLLSICCYTGMVIFAKYHDCDPLSAKLVERSEQLFPLFVMDTLGHLPGLPGLFVAGIFSGALSTVSSGLNSLAAIVMEDFVRPICWPNMSDTAATNVSKGLAVGIGLICFGLVFLAEQLGNALEAALSIFGMVGGPLLGVFTLGMFLPWANWIGATTGILSSLAFMFWIGFGSQAAKAQGLLVLRKKPLTVAGCPFLNYTALEYETPVSLMELFTTEATTTSTTSSDISFSVGDGLGLYKVSYMWYSAIGCWTVIVVGMIVSYLTGMDNPRKLNPDLICPVYDKLYCCLPQKWREYLRFNVGDDYVPDDVPIEEKVKPIPSLDGYSNSTFIDDNGVIRKFSKSNSYDVTKV